MPLRVHSLRSNSDAWDKIIGEAKTRLRFLGSWPSDFSCILDIPDSYPDGIDGCMTPLIACALGLMPSKHERFMARLHFGDIADIIVEARGGIRRLDPRSNGDWRIDPDSAICWWLAAIAASRGKMVKQDGFQEQVERFELYQLSAEHRRDAAIETLKSFDHGYTYRVDGIPYAFKKWLGPRYVENPDGPLYPAYLNGYDWGVISTGAWGFIVATCRDSLGPGVKRLPAERCKERHFPHSPRITVCESFEELGRTVSAVREHLGDPKR